MNHTLRLSILLGLLSMAAVAGAEAISEPGGWLSLQADRESGCLRGLTIAGDAISGPGGVSITEHTPAPPAAPESLPEALRGLYLPEKALEGLVEVAVPANAPITSLKVAWLGGDRYLWQVELPRPLAGRQTVILNLDTDSKEDTGSRDRVPGTELALTLGAEGVSTSGYMGDGTTITPRRIHSSISDSTYAVTTDAPLGRDGDGVAATVRVTTGSAAPVVLQVKLPHGGPGLVALGKAKASGGGWTRQSADGSLSVTETLKPQRGWIGWQVTVRNNSPQRRWLDLRLGAPLQFAGQWRSFDGFNLTAHETPQADLHYSGISAMLPLTAAWGEQGLAVALDPWSVYSELHSTVSAADRQALSLGGRIVVEPGGEQTLDFVLFGFPGSQGWRGAMSQYWRLFPEAFNRAADIDPRFHMVSTAGLYWSTNDPADPAYSPDLIRRLHAGWEWGYAPAPRPGEWAVSELSVGEWTRSRGTVKKSLSAEELPEVQERLRQRLQSGIADTAVAYYMHLKCVEQGLVKQHFPDSLMDTYGPVEYVGYYAQVPCLQLYPWGNSYGKYLQQAIPSVARRFAPSGFGFDSVFGLIPHHGNGMLETPGRSFENGRLFVAEGCGFAQQMDVVREQHTVGYRTGMVTNLKLPTLMCDAVRTDSALLEFHPFNNPSYVERNQRLRLMAGRKMISWWHTYDPKQFAWLGWDKLTPEQTLDAFRRLRDDLLLNSMYMGATPNARFSVGVPKLVKALPMLLEVSEPGWDPLVAARTAKGAPLLLSRFGSGAGMCLGVGNQDYEPYTDDVVVDQLAAGNASMVFADLSPQSPVSTRYEVHYARIAGVTVAPRNVRAYRAVASAPIGSLTGAEAVWAGERGQPWELKLSLTPLKAGKTAIRVWLPKGHVRPEVTLAGRKVSCRGGQGFVEAEVALAQGKNEIVVRAEPLLQLTSSKQALLDFPFVRDGRPNVEIVAPEDLQPHAQRLVQYFKEYYAHAVDEPIEVVLPVVSPAQAKADKQIVLNITKYIRAPEGPPTGRYGVEGDKLVVSADNPEVLHETIKQMLYTLDEKYVYWGPLSIAGYYFGDPAKEAPEAIRAGIAGKLLEGEDTGSLPNRDRLPRIPVYE